MFRDKLFKMIIRRIFTSASKRHTRFTIRRLLQQKTIIEIFLRLEMVFVTIDAIMRVFTMVAIVSMGKVYSMAVEW